MTARLTKWSEENNFLPAAQAGFRSKKSTTHQAFILNTIVEGRMRKNRTTYAAFIDFTQAFDSVDRTALWFKLSKLGISEKFLNILKSMYKNSKFSIKTDGGLTIDFKSETGVLQGAQNSPTLFIHFLADLADHLTNEEGDPPCLMNVGIPVLLFADDVVVLSTSVKGLQKQLNKLADYCNTWNLKVNLGKTKIVVFKKGRKLKNVEKWKYKDIKVEVVGNYKYLGVDFSFNNKWNVHTSAKAAQCKYATSRLLKFVRRHKDCSLKLFLQLFDAIITPAMLYGAEVFFTSPRIDVFGKIEHMFYRNCLGLANGVSGCGLDICLNRIGICDKIKMRALIFWHKIALDQRKN